MAGDGSREYNLHWELINKCRRHDKDAQFEIYKLYYKAMFNTSLRIVGSKAEAEDIMQESFLSAFSKINAYKGDVSFGAWLKRIVINKSIDCLRKRKAGFEVIIDDIKDEYYEQELNEQEIDHEFIERIKKAINELPEGYRIVLSLNLLEGYDHQEISQILNITESGSRSQFVRARRKLLDILNNNR